MAIISNIAKTRFEDQLKNLMEDKLQAGKDLDAARGLGDLRENTEYEVALQNYTKINNEILRISGILENSRVEKNYPNIISPGVLLSIQEVDKHGNIIDDLGILLFDAHGSALFDGTLSNSSNLGRRIEGSMGGEVTSQDIMGKERIFRVKMEPESKSAEYLEKYPSVRSRKVHEIFGR